MKSSRGFTAIELIIVAGLILFASVLFFVQKNHVETAGRDDSRKISINAIYYSLEEVYYAKSGSYPRTLNATMLPSVDPELFKDPSGVKIGESKSDFRYEPLNCKDDNCQSYTLRANLENEDDYVKNSRRK